MMAVMLVMLVTTAGLAMFTLRQVVKALDLKSPAQQELRGAARLRSDVEGSARVLLDMAWTYHDQGGALARSQEALARDIAAAEAGATTADKQAVLRDLKTQDQAFRRLADRLIQAHRAGRDNEAVHIWEKEGRPLVERTLDLTERYSTLVIQGAEEAQAAAQRQAGFSTIVLVFVLQVGIGLGIGMMVLVSRSIMKTAGSLTSAVEAIRQGDYKQAITLDTQDEFGQVARAFNQMTAELSSSIAAREQTEAELRGKLEVIERQQETIQALSTPILQIGDGILALPIVGVLDGERARGVMEALLESIVRLRARYAILDVTGVEAVDAATADRLVHIVDAAALVGAKAVITGIRPAVAQAIVGLGVSLRGVTTVADLREGLRACWRMMGAFSEGARREK
jgi:anti-anti-sigma regulatory factor/HAMP domain-containing protein